MTSDQTRHTAAVVPGAVIEGGPTAWSVSWLPGRLLLRDQAITAMTIAELSRDDRLTDSQSKLWLHIDGWAAELGLSGPHAVAEASLSPEEHGAEPSRDAAAEHDGSTAAKGDVPLPTSASIHDRLALIDVMTDHERSCILAYIARRAPEAFADAVASRAGGFAAELAARLEASPRAAVPASLAGSCAGGKPGHVPCSVPFLCGCACHADAQ
jgi:hypothetical protein